MNRYVIIGCGVAGVTAAEEIRKRDPEGRITIYNGEPYPYYFRAAMAFYIKGLISEEEVYGKPARWVEDLKVHMLNEKVANINTESKEVTGESGMNVPYDKLLIAAGAGPFTADWPGVDLDGVVTYRSLMCANKAIELVKKRKIENATVIGGGILGIELVDNLTSLGVKTTLLVRGERVLDLLFDEKASAIIQKQMEDDGVDIRFNTELKEIRGVNGQVESIVTTNDETIPAGLVGVAIGIRPSCGFLEGSGVVLDRGVLVDENLMTNIAGVYSAGDIAVRDVGGKKIPCRTWLTAAMQGKAAGANMADANAPFEEQVFFNASHAYKSLYAVIGQFNHPEGEKVEHVTLGCKAGEYGKIIVENGRVIGGMLVGHVAPAWDIYNAIENNVEVDIEKLRGLDTTRLYEALTGAPALLF